MLAADHRLRDSETFRRVVRSGRLAADGALVVHLRAGEAGSGPARAGLVVSKAVGDAVTRNRVKRRLRHLLRAPLDALPAGTDIVVRALPRARELSSAELGESLTRSLSRAADQTGARTGARRSEPMKAAR